MELFGVHVIFKRDVQNNVPIDSPIFLAFQTGYYFIPNSVFDRKIRQCHLDPIVCERMVQLLLILKLMLASILSILLKTPPTDAAEGVCIF
jgi:hypothetical protein|tara:strand:- start:164588 stop:164860 length:273 start_codon:yes stop_codon:yes gene_type:complete